MTTLKNQDGPSLQICFDVETDDDAHTCTPRGMRKFITHIRRFSRGEKGSSRAHLKLAWEGRQREIGLGLSW